MASTPTPEPVEGGTENPYVTSLVKNMRAINKKLSAMHKTDAVIEAHPNVSLDELVAQRKINNDQRASALKKPQLQAQLAALEEQVQQYKKFDADFQAQLQKQKAELTSAHTTELEKIKQEAQAEALAHGEAELKKKLLVFSQFLRAAAAKRNAEEDSETDENRAFEGTLLLVYGGDQKAVDTAISLIEGSDEQVTSIEGTLLPVKFAQVKQASVDHAPFPTDDTYAESAPVQETAGSDPTATHAGLTELQQPQTNGLGASTTESAAPAVQAEGNVAAERWDTTGGADKGGLEESYEIIPRPNEEVDNPVTAATEAPQQQQTTNWADETTAGNTAGESWDTKAPGQEAALDNITKTNGSTDDGFHEVPGRTRGSGRGRGAPRGGRGNPRGNGRGGPHRGGRRPRGDGAPARA